MWQDLIIAAVQWGLAVALLPTILHKTHKPALSTAIFNTALLAILAGTFASLGLWMAAAVTTLSSGAWALLAYQRRRLNSHPEFL